MEIIISISCSIAASILITIAAHLFNPFYKKQAEACIQRLNASLSNVESALIEKDTNSLMILTRNIMLDLSELQRICKSKFINKEKKYWINDIISAIKNDVSFINRSSNNKNDIESFVNNRRAYQRYDNQSNTMLINLIENIINTVV